MGVVAVGGDVAPGAVAVAVAVASGPGWNTGLGHDYGPIWGHVDLAIGERGGNKVESFADEGDITNIRRLWGIKSYDYIQQKRIRQVQKTHFGKLIGAAFSILDIVVRGNNDIESQYK